MGDSEDALECIEKSLEINPDNFIVWTSKGEILEGQSRYEESLLCYEKALLLNPDCEDTVKYKERVEKILLEKE